jgi:hypothetical protein
MPTLPRLATRYSPRTIGWFAFGLSVAATLVTWHEPSAVVPLTVAAASLIFSAGAAVRCALRRASDRIDTILCEELDAVPEPPRSLAEHRRASAGDGGL